MTRITAINGSPRMAKGNTAVVLDAFMQGTSDAGGEVEVFYTSRIKPKPCSCGEMSCWYKNPGECCIKDGMQPLYPRLKESTVLVLATPVYIPLPGDMQNFINRLCPLIWPFLETRHGRTRARFRSDIEIKKIALVATGGWWEVQNFDTVVRIAQELAEGAGVEFAGAVLRPHAFLMRAEGNITSEGEAVLDAVRQAGCELVREGVMAGATLAAVSRPLISQEELRRRYNQIL
jgi:multimeric flavodoxin WrbA